MGFVRPLYLAYNMRILDRLDPADSHYVTPSRSIQSENVNIANLAKQLHEKSIQLGVPVVEVVHRWLATNLTYNKDALNDDLYVRMNNSALSALQGRKCVCQGYTRLAVALFRALSIPSGGMRCIAIQTIEENRVGAVSMKANHVFPIVWWNDRWMLMDPTWDSRNIYEHGYFSFGSDDGMSKYPFVYFDNTLEFFSSTHEFVGISAE